MIEEIESYPGELKALRDFLDGYIESFNKDVIMENVTQICQEESVVKLFQDYLKRKEARDNYERLNKENKNERR
jgi:hypothetical protein